MAKKPSRWNPQHWGPGRILMVDVMYAVVLTMLLISWRAHWLGFGGITDPLGGFLPVGVPWFGALGALTISLYGVADHQTSWNTKYNLWHLTRPIVGTVLGTVAFLIFLAVIKASTSSSTPVSTGAMAIPYFAIAFAVGFREETFLGLITKLIDTLLTPGDSTPKISMGPSPVPFGEITINQAAEKTVTLKNTGSAPLVVAASSPPPGGLTLTDESGQFQLLDNVIVGATIAVGASADFTVRFAPMRLGDANGTVTLRCNAGTYEVPLSGTCVNVAPPS